MNDAMSKILAVVCAILFVLDIIVAVVHFCSGKIAMGVWMIVCAIMLGLIFI